MVRSLIENDNMQEQMCNKAEKWKLYERINRKYQEWPPPKKRKKNPVMKMKNAFDGLISRLDMVPRNKSVSLKIYQ